MDNFSPRSSSRN